MKSTQLTLLLLCCTFFSYAQHYSVSNFKKIDKQEGVLAGGGALNSGDAFGVSLDILGDIDDNGHNDLIVGAFGSDYEGNDKGAVYVLQNGANNRFISMSKIGDGSSVINGLLDPNDRFGGAVSNLGDINNDGLIEVAVGADYDEDGGYWKGAVYILSLNSNGISQSYVKISETAGGFTGEINGDAIFGTDIENIGDLDGDGVDDLAIGSRRDMDGGSNKGAVWILFMNSDLSIKKHQKISDTKGGLGFTIDKLDFFGGSVANIGDLNGDGRNEIAVGSYRDDDGAFDAGALYILFLNADGTVQKHQKISNTHGGLSNQISSEALFGESIDGTLDLDEDGKIEIVVGAMKQINSLLGVRTGAFFLIELNSDGTVSEDFLYTYGENCFTGNLNANDNFGGAVTILNNDPSNIQFAIGAYGDDEHGNNMGAVWIIELGEVSYSINAKSNSSSCGASDGSFDISTQSPNTPFTISYEFNSTNISSIFNSNADGILLVPQLSSGTYKNITVTNMTTLCNDNLGNLVIEDDNTALSFDTFKPSSCDASDGSIRISNVVANHEYTVAYTLHESEEQVTLNANNSGELTVMNLKEGIYEDISVTDNSTNCTKIIPKIEINPTTLEAFISSTSNADCNTSTGSLEITTQSVNGTYSLSYVVDGNYNHTTTQSDENGIVRLNNLQTGVYQEILLVHNGIFGCAANLNDFTIEMTSDLIVNITSANNSHCTSPNGAIIFSNLNPSETYTISYDFESIGSEVQIISNDTGSLEVNHLKEGIYRNITIKNAAEICSFEVEQITIESSNFQPVFKSVATSSCYSSDGSISITFLESGKTYDVSYSYDSQLHSGTYTADSNGNIHFSDLPSGFYKQFSVTDNNTTCWVLIDQLRVEQSPFIEAELTTNTNEMFCDESNGKFLISKLPPNEHFQGSYSYEGTLFEFEIASNENGTVEISGLPAGNYLNLKLVNADLCEVNFYEVHLECKPKSSKCFNVKNFFTPNGDGINDLWNLELLNPCQYQVFIFDRFGKQLAVLSPAHPDWDGTYNGTVLPSTDYWYHIIYTNLNQEKKSLKAHFTLKR